MRPINVLVAIAVLAALLLASCEEAPTPTNDSTFVIEEPNFQCGPSEPWRGFPQGFLSWTPDGADVVFSHYNAVWKVDREGTRLEKALDANPEPTSRRGQYYFVYWFHADISRDDPRLVYTSCQYPTEYEYAGVSQADAETHLDRVGADWYQRGKYQYEISLSGLDGKRQERLTNNLVLDHYPVWSPGGNRIAFLSSLGGSGGRQILSNFNPALHKLALITMSLDGSDVQQLATQLGGMALVSPEWSPDGQRLAVVVREGERLLYKLTLYVVESDDSEVKRIGETTGVSATWSPYGERLAFAGQDGQIIYTVWPDGADLLEIWRGEDDAHVPVSEIEWSPDGSAILFIVADRVQAMDPDGRNLRTLLDWQPFHKHATKAAWSPDGSRIAIYNPSEGVFTLAHDGTDLRALVVLNEHGALHAVPTQPEATAIPAAETPTPAHAEATATPGQE